MNAVNTMSTSSSMSTPLSANGLGVAFAVTNALIMLILSLVAWIGIDQEMLMMLNAYQTGAGVEAGTTFLGFLIASP